MRSRTRILWAALALAPAAACLSVKQEFADKRYYLLDAPPPAAATAPARVPGTILQIRRFHVSPRCEGKGFVYRSSESAYDSDFYNEFFIAPGAILGEEASRWIAAAGPFERVIDSASRLEPTHILEGSVAALHGDYREKGAPKAVIEIQFILLADGGADPRAIFQRNYRAEAPAKDGSPEALVEGWNAALKTILGDLIRDLSAREISAVRRGPQGRDLPESGQ